MSPEGEQAGENRGELLSPILAPTGADDVTPVSVFHDAVARVLDVQISTDDVLDTRNATVFSVASTILPVTFGLLGLTEREIPQGAKVTLVAAPAVYAVVLACAFRATFIRRLAYRPDVRHLSEQFGAYSGSELQEWVTLEYLASTETNQPHLQQKARWMGAASAFLYVEALLLSIAGLLTLL
jgi:hypothetical protein